MSHRSGAYAGLVPDLARFLPLSNRPHGDEAGVSSDRRAPLAAVVGEAARLLDGAASDRAAEFAKTARVTDAAPTPIASPDDLRIASAAIAEGKRRSTKTLARAVREVLRLGDELGVEPRLDATTLGIVSLYGATAAPLERRAVLQGHALRATDAEWEFGRGPALEARAIDIARFVLGVSDVAPRPAAPRPAPESDA